MAGTRFQIVVAGAPGIDPAYYSHFVKGTGVKVVYGKTYPLLSHSRAAAVTSGTATLETALFQVPQVVCYKTPVPKLISFLRRRLLKVKYISLVNLIAGHEVVKELVADTFSEANIAEELSLLAGDTPTRAAMLRHYGELKTALGEKNAADNAAKIMTEMIGD